MDSSTAKILFFQFILTIVGFFYLFLYPPIPSNASEKSKSDKQETIILDPGHGGDDFGINSKNGSLEKGLTLTLAKSMSAYLAPQYRVILTRDSDVNLSLADRTALANHQKADLFISIHLGGAFENDVKASFIMYYSPPYSKNIEWSPQIDDIATLKDPTPTKWENLQLEHISASRKMAKLLQTELLNQRDSIAPIIGDAPLYVLSGATMPALLIEPFFLSNSDTKEQFERPEKLKQLAQKLAAAISAALNKNNN